jgi:hypothetical protein
VGWNVWLFDGISPILRGAGKGDQKEKKDIAD